MTNNKRPAIVVDKVDLRVERARNRILALYTRLRGKGGWRAVQEQRKLPNVSYAWEFAVHGKIPPDPGIRRKLWLPGNLKQHRVRKARAPLTAWQKWWRTLSRTKRNNFVRELWRQSK